MREKRFTLRRSQCEELWRRFSQTDDRRAAEQLHAILLLDAGQNAHSVSAILHLHPNTLECWIKTFITGGEEARTRLNDVGGESNLRAAQQQFCTWLDADVRSTAEAIAWVVSPFGVSSTNSRIVKFFLFMTP